MGNELRLDNGLFLETVLFEDEHEGEQFLSAIACSHASGLVATGSSDGTIRVAKLDGELVQTFRGSSVAALALSSTGKYLAVASKDAAVWVWDTGLGQLVTMLRHSASVTSVAWVAGDSAIVSGAANGAVRLYSGDNWSELEAIELPQTIHCVAVSPTADLVAIGSSSDTVVVWDPKSGRTRNFKHHTETVTSVAFSPDGRSLASASLDASVVIWEVESGRASHVIERHTTEVVAVAFSPGGHWLASKSGGGRVRLTRCHDFAELGYVLESSVTCPSSIAFCGDDRLVSYGLGQRSLRVWRLPHSEATAPRVTHYCNAKIVLLGDSGVGKSGLALALTDQAFVPTDSTHGRRVWQLPIACEDERINERRELLLWDLAGQPSYRLVHQLHLHDANVALIVFDSKSEIDPLGGVRYWERALRQAERTAGAAAPKIRRVGVVARIDRGGVNVPRVELEKLVSDLSLDCLVETSAKLGTGIAELRRAITAAIDWNVLPRVVSSDLLERVKARLAASRARGALMTTIGELFEQLQQLALDSHAREELHACVARLESRGLVRCLTFGECVLLEPELLDGYATAIIEAAREEPDGLGCIGEDEVRLGRFRLAPEHRLDVPRDEALLLIATIELLLRSEIALREHTDQGTMLIFPAQSTRIEPPEYSHVPAALRVRFQGATHSIYTTLAVRLCRSGVFRKRRLWKDGLLLEDVAGALSGVRLRQLDEAMGELELFHLAEASDLARMQLAEFVNSHVQRRAVLGSVSLQRGLVCGKCRETVPERQVELRRAKGFATLQCPICDTVNSLSSGPNESAPATRARISEMDRNADRARDGDSGQTTAHGKRQLDEFDVFLCHNARDKPGVRVLADRLEAHGILPWLDERAVTAGTDWIKALQKQIRKIRCACVCVGSSGVGPWQDVELKALLNEFSRRRCRLIPVILSSATKKPRLPPFLNTLTWVDFRQDEPEPMQRLVEALRDPRLA